jgi:cysteine desulfurase
MEKLIYLDHAATTYVDREVLEKMLPWFSENYGNPSSIYSIGRKSKKALEDARAMTAAALKCRENEIYFTGSGTEADNWAIKGTAFSNSDKGRHIITTNIEHHAVYDTCKYLEKHGFKITYVPVEKNGIVLPEKIRHAIRKDTILITVMYANNEIGTIQPIQEIGKIAKDHGITFHTDAVQAAGTIPIDLKNLNVDMLSLSAHKFYGPKETGALYVRKGTRIDSLLHGGAQERTRRASTENTAGVVGLAHALDKAVRNMEKNNAHIKNLRDRTLSMIMDKVPHTIYNGDREHRLPGNLNLAIRFVEGESLILLLDNAGIMASSGSACTSGSLDPSHVLLAIGLPHEIAHGSLRLSFGLGNNEEEIPYIADSIEKIVQKLRSMSPLYEDYVKNKGVNHV